MRTTHDARLGPREVKATITSLPLVQIRRLTYITSGWGCVLFLMDPIAVRFHGCCCCRVTGPALRASVPLHIKGPALALTLRSVSFFDTVLLGSLEDDVLHLLSQQGYKRACSVF